MKRIATLNHSDILDEILPYLDGVIIGHEAYASRLSGHFSKENIVKTVAICAKAQKQVYIAFNKLFHPSETSEALAFLEFLSPLNVSGIIFGDVGIVTLAKTLNMQHLLIYNPDTLVTNVFDFNFLALDHIQGAFVSKEIVLEDILEIAKHKAYPLFMIGHGYLNMFHSKRKLLSAYKDYAHVDNELTHNRRLTLKEETRESAYPIIEDDLGTHIFRENVFASLAYLDALKESVDVLVIDTIFMSREDSLFIAKLYQLALTDPSQAALMVKPYLERTKQTWDDGFLNKKTVYKKVNV